MAPAASGRLVNKADFERLLGVRPWRRSAHFALHHVPRPPVAPRAGGPEPGPDDLSTDTSPICDSPVDKFDSERLLGCVVAKRLARRAVTRNLLRRQAHAVFAAHAARLPPGLYLLRLRAAVDKQRFPSAASFALATVVRSELDALFTGSAR